MNDKPYLEFPVDKSEGSERGYDGDSVGITFATNGKAHSVVTEGVSRTITTMCDHDVGVVVVGNYGNGHHAKNVYSADDSVAPTITTGNHGLGQAIAESDSVVTLGHYPGPRWKQARRVVSKSGVSPTITAEMGGHGNDFVHVFDEYGLSDAMQRYIVSQDDKYIGGKNTLNPTIAKAITTREGSTRADASSYISPDCPDDCEVEAGDDGYPVQVGNIHARGVNEMTGRVYGTDGSSPSVRTFCGGNQEIKLDVTLLGGVGEKKSNGGTQYYEQDRVYDSEAVASSIPAERSFHPNYATRLRIRKLTEGECMRLMGFESADTEACRSVGQSKANIYHQAGDSIVTTVLMGIFGELLGMDYEAKIEEYADKLHEETLK